MICKVRQQQISFKVPKFDLIVTITVTKDTKHSSQNMQREATIVKQHSENRLSQHMEKNA